MHIWVHFVWWENSYCETLPECNMFHKCLLLCVRMLPSFMDMDPQTSPSELNMSGALCSLKSPSKPWETKTCVFVPTNLAVPQFFFVWVKNMQILSVCALNINTVRFNVLFKITNILMSYFTTTLLSWTIGRHKKQLKNKEKIR